MSYSTLQLKSGKLQSIQRRHPWIFSGALQHIPVEMQDGQKIYVSDQQGNILATGHFGSASIAVRILAFEKMEITAAHYEAKLREALAIRSSARLTENTETNAYRLVHGEGDQLPGLIIDYYNGVVVLQAHSAGMMADAELIKEALAAVYGSSLKEVIVKSAEKGLETILDSEQTAEVEILEHGVKFKVDVARGQKTGFFLDQRENRALLAKYAQGRKVLNSFCYSGGFSMYALRAGAEAVHSIDSSKLAMSLVEANLELNGFQTLDHESLQGDALTYLSSEEAGNAGYDLIVLDPPAFAKHISARHKAVQAYKRLNARALRILKPNGILFTFSCSQVVDTQLFEHTIAAAAIEAGRNVRILHHLHQPEDHPVSIFHPEGSYLKGLVLAVS